MEQDYQSRVNQLAVDVNENLNAILVLSNHKKKNSKSYNFEESITLCHKYNLISIREHTLLEHFSQLRNMVIPELKINPILRLVIEDISEINNVLKGALWKKMILRSRFIDLIQSDWKNIIDHLCVICDISLKSHSYYLCNKCNKVCEINPKISDKSICCNSDVEINNKITCSHSCHEKYIEKITKDDRFKTVIDKETNIVYLIPSRIEGVMTHEQLKNLPEWM